MNVTNNKRQVAENESDQLWYKMASISIVGLVTFVGDSARGILYPALWPLCQSLGGTRVELGYLVSMFSVGRMIVSTRYGIMADTYRHRFTLLISTAVLCVGAVLWSNTPFLGGMAMLFVAQFVMGIGTGNLGVLRSYVAEQAPAEKRTYLLARLSSLQYAGFAATPLAGAALFVAGEGLPGSFWDTSLPAYLIAFLALICCLLLVYPFRNYSNDEVEFRRKSTTEQGKVQEESIFTVLAVDTSPIDCNLDSTTTASTIRKSIADVRSNSKSLLGWRLYLESTDVPSGEVKNALHEDSDQESDLNQSFSDSASASHASASTTSVSKSIISARESTNEVISISLSDKEKEVAADRALVFNLFIFLNFTTRGVVAVYESQGSQLFLTQYGFSELFLGAFTTICGATGTVQLLFFKEFWCKHFNDMTLMLGGISIMGASQCLMANFGPDTAHKPWRFAASFFIIYAFGYPLGNSAVLGMFSQLQKSGKQAKAQGQFALFGSVARVIMPIASGYSNQYLDPTSAFGLSISLMALSLFGIVYLYWKIMYFGFAIDKNGKELSDSPFVDRNRPLSFLQKFFCIFFLLLAIVGILVMVDFGVSTW